MLIRLRNFATPYWTRLHEMQAQFYGFLGEQFSGTEDIRANGAQDYVMRRLYDSSAAGCPSTAMPPLPATPAG